MTKMAKRMRVTAVAVGLTSAALTARAAEKKYIAFGWEMGGMPPDVLLKHADAFDKTPLDGIGLYVTAPKPYDWRMGYNHVFDGPVWEKEAFAGYIPKFREAFRHKSLRHSFLRALSAPRTHTAWNDDATWGKVAQSMAVAGWLAKESGFVGICLDLEDYYATRQFFWREADGAYAETMRLARQRGRELLKPIFEAFPDVKLISFWMFSNLPNGYAQAANPVAAMADRGDLWPAFLNGVLDVMPPTATFIDGDENAYDYEAARGAFWQASVEQRDTLISLVASENRAKYRAQLSVSFGQYLEMYTNPVGHHHSFGPLAGSRLRHFVQNLDQATFAASEYVWFWGEANCWIPWGPERELPEPTSRVTYEERLPGLMRLLQCLKCRTRLPDGLTENLATGPNLGEWNDGKVKGTLVREGAEWIGRGVENGGFTVRLENVQPGDVYGIRFRVRGRGWSPGVSWKYEDKWIRPSVNLGTRPEKDSDGRFCEEIVVIPPNVDTFVLALGFSRQAAEDEARYGDVAVYRIGVD